MTDFDRVARQLLAWGDDVERAVSDGLFDAAQEFLGRSARYCPIEDGTLVASGEVARDGLTAYVGYGNGGAEAYVRKQYFDTTLRHDPGKRDHWMDVVAATFAPVQAEMIGRRVRMVRGAA